MPLSGSRAYVGFGFGAIQAGLFLYEAFRSGNFGRLVIAEVLPDLVEQIRKTGGYYHVNIAHADRLETARVGPVDIYNPNVPEDREKLIQAVAEAHEMSTAVPSVNHYTSADPGSLHRVLAEGLVLKFKAAAPLAVIYTAENNNAAAEILEALMAKECGEKPLSRVQFLNTVIGKMSGLVEDPTQDKLAAVTPANPRAFLVESFNRILISKIRFPAPFQRGITVFEEKADLLPFEEAKLYGHNATHVLAAYLGALAGLKKIFELRSLQGCIPFLRAAFLEESGQALIRKHRGIDPLFTPEGYTAYVDDLLARMTNPLLQDTIERVGRDPGRKLGWDDRLVGTMRLALSQGVEPRRYAIGAAAGFAVLDKGFLDGRVSASDLALPLWKTAHPVPAEIDGMLECVEQGRRFLATWRRSQFSDIETLFAGGGDD